MSNDNTPKDIPSSAQEKLPPVWWWDASDINKNWHPYYPPIYFTDLETVVEHQRRYHRGEKLEAGVLPDRLLFDPKWKEDRASHLHL